MKTLILILTTCLFTLPITADEMPPNAVRLLDKLEEFKRKTQREADDAIVKQTRAVIAALEKMAVDEGRKGDVDRVVALRAAIETIKIDPPKPPAAKPDAPYFVERKWKLSAGSACKGYHFHKRGKGERIFQDKAYPFTWESHEEEVAVVELLGVEKRFEFNYFAGTATVYRTDQPDVVHEKLILVKE